MKKLFFFFTTCYLLLTTCYQQAFAHTGGGPPFLEVDGVYAVTNPYYYGDPTINIPQDYTGKTYLVNQPIHLFVDTNQLLVPPDIAAASTFRWTLEENGRERLQTVPYEFGQKLQHTYTKPGSYIISLEVKAPGETEYTLIDTVQLDVLPNTTYKLPQAQMAVGTNHRQSTKPILFSSAYTVDPSAKVASIIWGFGDNTTAKDASVMHTYTNMQDYSTIPVIFRVKDSNNFSGYAGIILVANKGTLHFVDNNGKENTIPVSDTITIPNKTRQAPFLLPIIIVVLVVISIIAIVVIKKKFLSLGRGQERG